MQSKYRNWILSVALLIVLVSTIFFIYDVSARPTVGLIQSTKPNCDFNNTDITARVLSKLLATKPYPGVAINLIPQKIDDANYIIAVSDINSTFMNYYLYNAGFDGLWANIDDSVYFISNSTQTGYGFVGMISQGNSTEVFYFAMHDAQNPEFDIYSCTLSGAGCNSSLVASIPDPYEVISLLPYEFGNKLFIAIEDTSITSIGGSVLSCSLLAGMSDSCSLNYSSFNTILINPPFTSVASFRDHGFMARGLFYSARSSSTTQLPVGQMVGNHHAVSIPSNDQIIFFKRYLTSNLIDVIALDTSNGQMVTIYTDSTGIQPHFISYYGTFRLVYERSSMFGYSQFIKVLGSSAEAEIYRASGYLFSGRPIGVQSDNRLISLKIVGGNPRIYRSNCKA